MNALNRDLIIGQKVVMEGSCPKNIRTVTITGGYGRMSSSRGTALFVTLLDGSPGRMDSMEIESVVEENLFEDR
ncbi:MAG: hypothetical protein DRN81_06345 [Thermoproteota archaeon]|nr:MAG: hypothetical protein DRN81_06345 [Candidatus Korarchaeota archaeon]